MTWTVPFDALTLADLPRVGGKNASLGELIGSLRPRGVRVPDGFAVIADAYRRHLGDNATERAIADLVGGARKEDVADLTARATRIRDLILARPLPQEISREITAAYRALGGGSVAVRSSATAEDLPGASFAGQQESFLHVDGDAALLDAVRRCFASLFTARAIAYRIDMGFDHAKVALSVGVQRMVRADLGSSGVLFTLDTESGFRDVVVITSTWGLGETVVQGRVQPDELYVHKPTLAAGARPLIWTKIGSKEQRMVLDVAMHRLVDVPTSLADRRRLSLGDEEALTLARWAVEIERHYSEVYGRPTPMDVEWAKDGETGELFVVQARPETVHSQRARDATVTMYRITGTAAPIAQGIAIGEAIAIGPARVVRDAREIDAVRPGDVLVTDLTDPDWEPIMKSAAALVTERGGRTSHAAIIAREIGIPAVVGVEHATRKIPDGEVVTVSCVSGDVGRIYWGTQPFAIDELDARELPATRTRIYMNVAHPDRAFRFAQIPCDGVGLARMEHVLATWVRVHPLALIRYQRLRPELQYAVDKVTGGATDRPGYFVDRLAQGIAVVAAAFWPRPVVLRFSDFKTSEYARLLGGLPFEPQEPNPMLGWRGASRYAHAEYEEGFRLECAAVRKVREEMGLTNLALMVPFCRTPDEAARVLETAAAAGLPRGAGLAWHLMAELPSNVLLADRFAELFDGFSIDADDLTQLVLGVDRGSPRVAPIFDERDEAVKRACVMLLDAAHARGRTVGICGQGPSDHPDFAAFLVEHGIDSLSLTPDAVVPVRRRIAELEAAVARRRG